MVDLFRVYHIQLGYSEQDQLAIIRAIQNMDRAKFELVIQGILLRTRSTPQDHMVVMDHIDSLTNLGVLVSDLGAL